MKLAQHHYKQRGFFLAKQFKALKPLLAIWLVVLTTMLSSTAWAHQASTAYLTIQQDPQDQSLYRVDYELSLRDLVLLLALDQNNDSRVTWAELQAQHVAFKRLINQEIMIKTATGNACRMHKADDLWLNTHAGETYVLQKAQYRCDDKLSQLDYRVLSEVDDAHRVILTLKTLKPEAPSGHHHHGDDEAHVHESTTQHNDATQNTAHEHQTASQKTHHHGQAEHSHTHASEAQYFNTVVIDPNRYNVISLPLATGIHDLDLAQLPWWNYVYSGMHHLLIGWDHLLFLFSLIVAAVYIPSTSTGRIQLQPVNNALQALKRTFWLATTFTIAHSITLCLAALDIVSLPSRFIESVIAFSIAIIAFNNLKPLFWQGLLPITFAFGLIHGFGFANVIVDLPVSALDKALALFLFNVGIELGQILCIVIALPVAFYLRKTAIYKHVVFQGGSVIAVLFGLYWFAQRAFGL